MISRHQICYIQTGDWAVGLLRLEVPLTATYMMVKLGVKMIYLD